MLTPPTILDLLPGTFMGVDPIEVTVGRDFDTVSLPEDAALRIVDALEHIRPHPVGAAIAQGDQWVLFLQRESGEGMSWPWPAEHRNTGSLSVPPLSTSPAASPRWARLGNGDGRVFSAALPLFAAIPLLTQPRQCSATRTDRTPVRF